MHFFYLRQLRELVFDIGPEHVSHAAPGRSHGHFDLDFVAAALGGRDLAGVDEAKINDVDGDFWIVNGLQLVPNELLAELAGRGLCLF